MKNDSLQALMRPNTDQDEGHFHLGYLLDTLRDNLKLITMMTVITMLIGIGYVLVARPVYQSDIMIQVEDNPNSPNNLLASVSSMFDVKSAAADEAEIC
ncbi:subunit length determinant protein [Paraburkholderia sp. BL8N3]|nr:Wzz/FepE/Etk N-terminal domain-containing protein [Paraburkholderia sp. BL8N3]TCK34407.1 subunit length determinant protein [Paraburkholderia sp. BL8N3]